MKYLFAITACLIALSAGSASAENVIDDSASPDYLFTLAAKSGTFDGKSLTLKDVPLVVYFADRPHRIAGHVDLQTFVDKWGEGADNFMSNPPNAELAIYRESGDTHAVVVIRTPVVSNEDISFDVTVISETLPKSFAHATLFIDGLGLILPGRQN